MKVKLLVTTLLCSAGFLATTSVFADSTQSMGSTITVLNAQNSGVKTISLVYNITTPDGHNNGFGNTDYVIGSAPISFQADSSVDVYYTDIMSKPNNSQATGNMYIRNANNKDILCIVSYDSREFISGTFHTNVTVRGDMYTYNGVGGATCHLQGGNSATCDAGVNNGKRACNPTNGSWNGRTIYVDLSKYQSTTSN